MRMPTPFAAAVLGSLLALTAVRAQVPAPVPRVLEIRVDATGGGDDLGIELEASGLALGESFYVKRVVDPKQYAFSEPEFLTAEGEPVPHELINARYTVSEAPDRTMRVRYRVRPGGRARHGHQGLVTPRWAAFDGRAVLQPKEIAAYDEVRWRFELPEGWTVAGPLLAREGGVWAMPEMAPRYRASVLKSMCLGLGPFAEDSRRLGRTEFRVFTLRGWKDRERLAEGAHGVFRWFHEQLGFDPGRPWALVWTPPGPKMAPVWSGAGAIGACYERPQEGYHNWELLGHRLAHPMNEYPPEGFLIARPEDHWFMEGWATYAERPALAYAGVADLGQLNALYAQHQREIRAHPRWRDFRLAREPQARGEILENLHYRRGPLVVTMLADLVQRRTGRSFEAFMKQVFAEHRQFQKALDLRAELEAWAGQPFDDFWTAMVDEAGPVIPVWEAYEARVPALRPAPALRAGELVWTGEQLFGLLRSGRFEGAAHLAAELRETGRKHGELARRGVQLLPPALARLRPYLPPATRADVDELERRWPLEGGPPLPASGCAGPPAPVRLPALQALDPEGRLFLELVRAEEEARPWPQGREGLVAIRFGADDWEPERPYSAAAVSTEERLRVLLQWIAPPTGMHLEIWKGDQRLVRRWVEVQSDWLNTWMRLGTDAIDPSTTGLLEVRLVREGQVVGTRPFWRRASGPAGG